MRYRNDKWYCRRGHAWVSYEWHSLQRIHYLKTRSRHDPYPNPNPNSLIRYRIQLIWFSWFDLSCFSHPRVTRRKKNTVTGAGLVEDRRSVTRLSLERTTPAARQRCFLRQSHPHRPAENCPQLRRQQNVTTNWKLDRPEIVACAAALHDLARVVVNAVATSARPRRRRGSRPTKALCDPWH